MHSRDVQPWQQSLQASAGPFASAHTSMLWIHQVAVTTSLRLVHQVFSSELHRNLELLPDCVADAGLILLLITLPE